MQRDAMAKGGFKRSAILPGDPAGRIRGSGLFEPAEAFAVDDLARVHALHGSLRHCAGTRGLLAGLSSRGEA